MTPEKPSLHPRNRHQGRYDFPALIRQCPDLGEFVIINPYGKQSIDFANPAAVKVFNRALLKALYGIQWWDIPEGYLCPPVPGRADYLHGLADLLAAGGEVPRGGQVRVLDIGTGANCIYPLLGHADYRWKFVGSDIDPIALASARQMLHANGLDKAIELRKQPNAGHILQGIIQPGECFDLTLCNPPFHASLGEATRGSERKWRNLGKLDPKRKLPVLNFGGQSNELWCEGGELGFLGRLVDESARFGAQVGWFSSLVSKSANLAPLKARLQRVGAAEVQVGEMGQGQKRSRFLAWRFQ